MCGLYGWIEKKPIDRIKKENLTRVLSWKSESRGTDAWGLCLIDKNQNHKIKKGNGIYRLQNSVIENSTVMAIGHSRYGTHGDKNKKNAHPFEHGNLVMAHNGVIFDQKYKREGLLMPIGETDSEEFLTWLVSVKNGKLDDVFFSEIWDNQAFTFWQKDKKCLTIVVTENKPIYIAENEKVMVYSSEQIISLTGIKSIFPGDKTEESFLRPLCIFSVEKKPNGNIKYWYDKKEKIPEKIVTPIVDGPWRADSLTSAFNESDEEAIKKLEEQFHEGKLNVGL